MSDAFTTTSSVSTVLAAYDLRADIELRAHLLHDQFATKKAANQNNPGESVTFTIWDDLEVDTTPLVETQDVDAVEMTDSQVTVTLAEYGGAVRTTAKLRGTGFLAYDADAAEQIGRLAGLTLDTLARNELHGGVNAQFAGTATDRATVASGDLIKAANVKYAVAKLRAANAPGWMGGFYAAVIHPDVSYDYRNETGPGGWDDPAKRNEGGGRVWNGLIGRHAGADFIESPLAAVFADAGADDTDVYSTLVIGRDALAKAWSKAESAERPQVRVGPTTDKLRRFHTVGWYWLGGYKRYREACIHRIESASSIGDGAVPTSS